jgi:hypothetical protein
VEILNSQESNIQGVSEIGGPILGTCSMVKTKKTCPRALCCHGVTTVNIRI